METSRRCPDLRWNRCTPKESRSSGSMFLSSVADTRWRSLPLLWRRLPLRIFQRRSPSFFWTGSGCLAFKVACQKPLRTVYGCLPFRDVFGLLFCANTNNARSQARAAVCFDLLYGQCCSGAAVTTTNISLLVRAGAQVHGSQWHPPRAPFTLCKNYWQLLKIRRP